MTETRSYSKQELVMAGALGVLLLLVGSAWYRLAVFWYALLVGVVHGPILEVVARKVHQPRLRGAIALLFGPLLPLFAWPANEGKITHLLMMLVAATGARVLWKERSCRKE